MSALFLYVCRLMVGAPLKEWALPARWCQKLKGGVKIFWLALLANSHPPDQNSETAPALKYFVFEKV